MFSYTTHRRLYVRASRNSRNLDAALDANCGEKMAEIVMCDALYPDLCGRVCHTVLAFENTHHSRIGRLIRSLPS